MTDRVVVDRDRKSLTTRDGVRTTYTTWEEFWVVCRREGLDLSKLKGRGDA